MTDRLFS